MCVSLELEVREWKIVNILMLANAHFVKMEYVGIVNIKFIARTHVQIEY